jgi:hypothetical protein
MRYALAPLILLAGAGCAGETDEPTAALASELGGPNASTPATGQLEAVVNIGNCTGTLISQDTVLTAAHCVCGSSGAYPATGCQTRKTVTFTNVVPAAGGARQNVSVGANVLVHPAFNETGWLRNDYTLLRLDTRADALVRVAPMRVSRALPSVGETHTLVGYGGAGGPCDGSFGVKRRGTSTLDQVVAYGGAGGRTLVYNDTSLYACPGDSGGPVLDAAGRVAGVCSHGDFATNSNYDPTSEVWPWLRANACTAPDAATGAATLCREGPSLVTTYRSASYGGTSQAFGVGQWDVESMDVVGNDTISSLIAKPGATVRLFAEARCWGDSQLFTGSVASVGTLLDNRTSCLRASPGVTVYASTGYAGAKQTFEIGGYNHTAMGVIGNDQVESLIASPGVVVRICSESGAPGTVGWGTCVDYSGSVPDLGAMKNRASNIEVVAGVTLYRDADFGGVSQTLRQGSWNAAALSVVGNDTVSSLVVGPGLQARICSESGLWGDCQTYTGAVAQVTPILNDRTSSVAVSPIP